MDWVDAGGTLVTLRDSSTLPESLGLTTATSAAPTSDIPGSLIRVELDRDSPLARDVARTVYAMYEYELVWTTPLGASMVGQYPGAGDDDWFISGFAQGAEQLHDTAPLVDEAFGDGPVRRHPVALLRDRMIKRNILTAEELKTAPTGRSLRYAGIVNVRQSPGTANNTTFMTLEDETGEVNVIVWSRVAQEYRTPFLAAQLLEVQGELQRESGVMHLIAKSLVDRSAWLGQLHVNSRDFH